MLLLPLTSNFVHGEVMDDLDFKVGTEILIRKVVMSCSDGSQHSGLPRTTFASSVVGPWYVLINLSIQRVLKVAVPRTRVPRQATLFTTNHEQKVTCFNC